LPRKGKQAVSPLFGLLFCGMSHTLARVKVGKQYIHSWDRKRKELSGLLQGGEYRLLAPREQRQTFGPSRGDIGERQGIQEASFHVPTSMSHQIRFHKAWLGFIPVLKGTNGDLVFKQASRFGGDCSNYLTLSQDRLFSLPPLALLALVRTADQNIFVI
jgi:hypothetical protein